MSGDAVGPDEPVRLLAAVGQQLGASLDLEETLQTVARLVVSGFADLCSIYLCDDEGRLRPVAVAHVDPARERLLQDLRARYPLGRAAAGYFAELMRSGQVALCSDITAEVLESVAVDEEHRELLRELGIGSGLMAPLIARGRTLGLMTLGTGQTSQRLGPSDVELARELAARAALAIDNARLYGQVQASLERHELLLRIAHQLAAESDPDDCLHAVAIAARDLVGAHDAAVFHWHEDGQELVRAWCTLEGSGQPLVSATDPATIPLGKGATGRAALERRTIVSNDYQSDFGGQVAPVSPHIQAAAAIPLLHEGDLLGVLTTLKRRAGGIAARPITPSDVAALELLAGLAAATLVGLERARLRAVAGQVQTTLHDLSNDLALAVGTIELVQHRVTLPADLSDMVEETDEKLVVATGRLRELYGLIDHHDAGRVERRSEGGM